MLEVHDSTNSCGHRDHCALYRVAKICDFTLILRPEVCVGKNEPLRCNWAGVVTTSVELVDALPGLVVWALGPAGVSGETVYTVPEGPTY